MSQIKKPTSIDVDAMPEETINYLADATWEFIQELMQTPVAKAMLDERVAAKANNVKEKR